MMMTTQITRCPKCASENVIFSKKHKVSICEDCGYQSSAETPPAPLRIFLSYGHDANEALVRCIKADLQKRGHDVWFDKSEIKVGDDWRRAITDGIINSSRVLSFLSKHSMRDPGVCLDEIGIAIGVKGGNIQTILVESETEVKPPASISHIQWLDMHDWKDRRAAGETAWAQWYQAKLAEIVRVVESEESRRFAGEIEILSEYLGPISSDSRIASLLQKGFVGRTWLVEAIEQWRKAGDRNSRLFWIVGDPGVGKSAFAAHLTHFGRDRVIAAQFIEWDKADHRNAQRVIRSLAFQLATRLPDYRKLLLTLPEIAELDRKNDAAELFDYLLANPLHSVIHAARERYLIVMDALDEASEAGRNPLVEILARHAPRLPDWIGIVVTSRPESAVRAPLQGLNPLILNSRSEANRADIRDYIRRELEPQIRDRTDADRLVESILEKSEGVFLYVERFCSDVRRNLLPLARPEQFPQGLGGIFYQFFQRQFPNLTTFRKEVRPALRTLLAAREPLPVKMLQQLFTWQDEEIRDFARCLGSLFPISIQDGQDVIKPYHKSLADWLADEVKAGVYFASINEGHKVLAVHGWSDVRRGIVVASKYSIAHLPWHLANANRGEDFVDLLRWPEYAPRLRQLGRMADVMCLCSELLTQRHFSKSVADDVGTWLDKTPEEVIGRMNHEANLERECPNWTRLGDAQKVWIADMLADVLRILKKRGFAIASAKASTQQETTVFERTEVECLAEDEHDRWCRERFSQGWTYGDPQVGSGKRSLRLLPWRELPEPAREVSRSICKRWPAILKSAGITLSRTAEATKVHRSTHALDGNLGTNESLVKVFCEALREDSLNRAENAPSGTVRWELLSASQKEVYWRQVADTLSTLYQTGFGIRRVCLGPLSEPLLFSADEIEHLAELEHDRWCRERMASGWRYGRMRDNVERLHPALVAWSELSEEYRKYDRAMFPALVRYFAAAGYEVHRLESC